MAGSCASVHFDIPGNQVPLLKHILHVGHPCEWVVRHGHSQPSSVVIPFPPLEIRTDDDGGKCVGSPFGLVLQAQVPVMACLTAQLLLEGRQLVLEGLCAGCRLAVALAQAGLQSAIDLYEVLALVVLCQSDVSACGISVPLGVSCVSHQGDFLVSDKPAHHSLAIHAVLGAVSSLQIAHPSLLAVFLDGEVQHHPLFSVVDT